MNLKICECAPLTPFPIAVNATFGGVTLPPRLANWVADVFLTPQAVERTAAFGAVVLYVMKIGLGEDIKAGGTTFH
jgi:hypothetical protein